LVYALLELLADLEERQALGVYSDGIAGPWISPLIGLVAPDLEAAEASNLDPVPVLEGVLHGVKYAIDDQLRLPFGQIELSSYLLDKIRLGHTYWPRYAWHRQSQFIVSEFSNWDQQLFYKIEAASEERYLLIFRSTSSVAQNPRKRDCEDSYPAAF
jgi:hypothetical protein